MKTDKIKMNAIFFITVVLNNNVGRKSNGIRVVGGRITGSKIAKKQNIMFNNKNYNKLDNEYFAGIPAPHKIEGFKFSKDYLEVPYFHCQSDI